MSEEAFHILSWALGAVAAILVFMAGIAMQNSKDHRDIHDKIDENHHSIRDRLESIWKHLSKTPD